MAKYGSPSGVTPPSSSRAMPGCSSSGQDPALLEEAAEDAGRRPLDQLDRGPLLELAVGALAEVDRAHAALAEQPDDAPRADAVGRTRRDGGGIEQRLRDRRGRLQETLAPVRVEQAEHFGVDLGIVAGGPLGERHLLLGGDVEEGVEHGVDAAVAVSGRGGHRSVQDADRPGLTQLGHAAPRRGRVTWQPAAASAAEPR